MKKSYLLLLCGLCLMTACSSTSNTKKQTIATLSPTIYKNENNVDASTNTNDENSSPYDFLIERYLLKDPGSNITVDSALNLIIDQINPAMRVKLKSGERIAYKFLGYRLFDDGNCYMIGFGTNSNQGFQELYRFAVSYNKTIYESAVHDGHDLNYTEVYSIDGDYSESNSIVATIKNGILTIQDGSSKKTINKFSLSSYDLDNAKTSDLVLLDMNFDGYSDVAILQMDKDYHSRYHAFLYDPRKNKFKYQNSYSNLPSPVFNTDLETISCSEIQKTSMVYDTYTIINNEPEIKERISYKYIKKEKLWRVEHSLGENGDLRLIESKYYTSKQVSSELGEFVSP